MRFFGLSLIRRPWVALRKYLSFQTTEASRGWIPLVREGFAGAWQRGVVGSTQDVLAYAAVYACVTLIANDISKLRIKLVRQDEDGIWHEAENSAFSPFLRKPNSYQTRIEFIRHWVLSKYIHGNAYILKDRDRRGLVVAGHVLDPCRVKVMVAPDGSVFYGLSGDNLAGLEQSVEVPASEIIHDKCPTLYHPLCGVSPITACALAALQGLRIQNQSELAFSNGSIPSGVLSSVQDIDDEQAREIQARWQEQFTGNNFGKVAVLGLDMKYQPMTIHARDAQLIEQLKMTGEMVCTAFGVPAYKVGIGPPPSYNNIEALNIQYYTDTLQNPIESIELLLDEGMGLAPEKIDGVRWGTEFDIDALTRMDTATRVEAAAKAIRAGLSPNEVRFRYFDVGPANGGNDPFLQQQDWPMRMLAERKVEEITEAPPQAPVAQRLLPAAFTKADKVLALHALEEGWQQAAA